MWTHQHPSLVAIVAIVPSEHLRVWLKYRTWPYKSLNYLLLLIFLVNASFSLVNRRWAIQHISKCWIDAPPKTLSKDHSFQELHIVCTAGTINVVYQVEEFNSISRGYWIKGPWKFSSSRGLMFMLDSDRIFVAIFYHILGISISIPTSWTTSQLSHSVKVIQTGFDCIGPNQTWFDQFCRMPDSVPIRVPSYIRMAS